MKKRTLLLSAVAIAAAAGIALGIKTRYLLPSDQQLSVPADTRYVITYSTGRDAKENSQINYLDKNAQLLSNDMIDGVTDMLCFQQTDGMTEAFTLDNIYFEGKNVLKNEELQSTYAIATTDGTDQVLRSGDLNKFDLHWKLVSAGSMPELKNLGYFSLLILYNNDNVYNVPVRDDSCIAADQKSGILYHLSAEDTGKQSYEFFYQTIAYDKPSDKFTVTDHKLDLSAFLKDHADRHGIYSFGQTVISQDSLYQIIEVGESKQKTYLLEFAVDRDEQELVYQSAYPMKLKSDDRIDCFTTTTVEDGVITYYPPVHPMDIVSFDTNKKTFTYTPLALNRTESDLEQEMPYIRECSGTVYLLETRIQEQQYQISELHADGTRSILVKGTLPKSRLGSSCGISDFYCME